MAALVEMKFTISDDPHQGGYFAALEYAYNKADPDRYFNMGGYGGTPEEAFARLAACIQDFTPRLSEVCGLHTQHRLEWGREFGVPVVVDQGDS